MSQAVLARSDLFSQTQSGTILGVDRRTVRDLALALKIEYKNDPTRSGKMLDRDDLERIAAGLGRVIDWADLRSN